MKYQNIHAHFDDFEFTASGTFELARRHRTDFSAQVVVCTDGAAGHHLHTREKTAAIRLQEQENSAQIGQYQLQCLKYADGKMPREGCMVCGPHLLAALWKTIREFQPDYLFCPPIPGNPLAGVHVDHLVIAEAMRKVAFLIGVPHAYSPEFPDHDPAPRFIRSPVILNVYDGYTYGNDTFDLAVDVNDVFDVIAEETWCHQSQITEWLPWIGGIEDILPRDFNHWKQILRSRLLRQNRDTGVDSDKMYEYFTLTGWGACPSLDQLLEEIPNIDRKVSRLEQLRRKIDLINRSVDG